MMTTKLKLWLVILALIVAGFWVFAFLRPDFIFYDIPSKGTGPYVSATSWGISAVVSLYAAAIMFGLVVLNGHRNDILRSWRGLTVLATIFLAIFVGVAIIMVSNNGIEKRQDELCTNSPASHAGISFFNFRARYCYDLKHPRN